MTLPATCRHADTVPVEVRDSLDAGTVPTTVPTTVVAHICRGCHETLPAAWGCTDCSWVEERAMCEPVPRLLLAHPCQEHA
ncbi:hypothetical protein [Nocardioides soli]|uniref:Uncharacterized protein n=1 Tax=Nocardioides soli TaxID=1036020 RepID=A0A7W4VTR6_9ACTN|nr:hypothetical protein [Nocardioides soli]MBB3041202.1 hypothetical protein [Nocardioides soli]